MSGPPLAGHVSALCVRLEILRAASASLSLTGPQRPDCATPGLSSSAPGPSPTGRGPDSYPRRLSPPTELNTLPSAPRPQPPCRPSRALGPPPSSYCSVCLSQPPVPSAPSCSSRVALRTWFCPSLHTSHRGSVADRGCRGCRPVCRQAASPHQAGKQERVRTPRNPPAPRQGCSQPAVGCRICVAPRPALGCALGAGEGSRAALQTLRGLPRGTEPSSALGAGCPRAPAPVLLGEAPGALLSLNIRGPQTTAWWALRAPGLSEQALRDLVRRKKQQRVLRSANVRYTGGWKAETAEPVREETI